MAANTESVSLITNRSMSRYYTLWLLNYDYYEYIISWLLYYDYDSYDYPLWLLD